MQAVKIRKTAGQIPILFPPQTDLTQGNGPVLYFDCSSNSFTYETAYQAVSFNICMCYI